MRAHHPVAAVIRVILDLDEESAVAWLRAGAENVVLESNLSRLGPATDSALAVRQPLKRLSRRQLEVMRLVTEGLTSREIAAGLGLSVKTVEAHRSAGMRRLGVGDITGLVRYSIRVGVVPQGPSSGGSAHGAGVRRVAASARQTPLQVAGD